MRFLFKRKWLLLLVAAVLFAILMAVLSYVSDGRISPASSVLGTIFKPAQTLVYNISDSIDSLFGYQREYEALRMENRQLHIRIAEMEEEARRSVAANEENARLRQLLGFAEYHREITWQSAGIIARDTSNWSRTLTLGRGTSHGIAAGQPVVSSEGFLVGIVAETGASWSTVVTVIDTDMAAGARIERTNESYVAEGDFELMQEGLLKLSLLPKDADIQNGDLILTSGIGELFPRDLPIGTVERVEAEADGISGRAVIRPSADLDRLTQVFIVLDYTITE